MRDAQFRGYTASETLARWPKVRQGEDKHIFPFQNNADLFFNSGLTYELAVLKLWAEPRLAAVDAGRPPLRPGPHADRPAVAAAAHRRQPGAADLAVAGVHRGQRLQLLISRAGRGSGDQETFLQLGHGRVRLLLVGQEGTVENEVAIMWISTPASPVASKTVPAMAGRSLKWGP